MQAKIAIVNDCSVLTDQTINSWLPSLQMQLDRDYAGHWTWQQSPAVLTYVAKGAKAPEDHWWLVVTDTSDVAGALGYHDLTPAGLPMGKVFAATDLAYNCSPSCTLSHELLEILGDADVATCIQVGNLLYARELCDPCELDEQGYDINGVLVSDFVLPRWFDGDSQVKGEYDFCKRIEYPRDLLPGGYQLVLDLDRANRGWQQLTTRAARANREIPVVGSRRERRMRRHRGGLMRLSERP